MKIITLILIFLVNLVCAEDLEDYMSGFDCDKKFNKYTARGEICEKVLSLNNKLNELYKSFYFVTNEMKEDHKEWIKNTKECKEDIFCLRRSYGNRVYEIKESLKNEKTFPKSYLEIMKKAQTDIRLKRVYDDFEDDKKSSDEFYEDFFRYKNIRFKEPILSKVSYEDIKLKELLKECIGYRLDYKVHTENLIPFKENYPLTDDIEDANVYWDLPLKEEYKIKDAEYSVWKVYLDYKDWLFVGRLDNEREGKYFMIDPNYCAELKYEGNIGEALNKDKEFFKYSTNTRFGKNYQIIDYKNRAYLIGERDYEDTVGFYVKDILGLDEFYKPMNVLGKTYTAINFEIEKNR